MSQLSSEDKVVKLSNILRQVYKLRLEYINSVFDPEVAKKISDFINILWSNLKIPEDVKVRVIENIVDCVLRATLGLKVRKTRKESEEDEEKYITSSRGII